MWLCVVKRTDLLMAWARGGHEAGAICIADNTIEVCAMVASCNRTENGGGGIP